MDRRTLIKTLMLCCVSAVVPAGPCFCDDREQAPASRRTEPDTRPRVVRVSHAKATSWDYATPPYIDYIDYEIVKIMLEEGLTSLTGAGDARDAWRSLIRPYTAGDKIVIKPNLNNTGIGYAKAIMTSPQVIAAVIESLIQAGYPSRDIVVFDLTARESRELEAWITRFNVQTVFMTETRSLIGKAIDKVKKRFFFGPAAADTRFPINMREAVREDNGEPVTCYLPRVLTTAQHLINIPVLKGHQFLLQSGALKNHFGTVRFSNRNSYPVVLHGKHIESHLVDINRNEHIRMKTRIVIADALLGAACFAKGDRGRLPTPWKTFAAGRSPNSLVLSKDPVALESIAADHVLDEQKSQGCDPLSHDYLHDAAECKLGVHEHRGADGKYARIDYRVVVL